jgi:hypothetical protein
MTFTLCVLVVIVVVYCNVCVRLVGDFVGVFSGGGFLEQPLQQTNNNTPFFVVMMVQGEREG